MSKGAAPDGSSTPAPLRALVDSVRDPEHTGDDRCLPCTAVNAVGVAVAATLLFRRRRSLGLLLAAAGAAAIWLRGYVLPRTPRFAPRIVEPLPVEIGPDHDLESDSLAAAGANSPGDDRPDVTDARSESDPRSDGAEASTDLDGADAGGIGDDGDDVDPEAVMAALIEADALVEDGDALVLDEGFRDALYDRVGALREGADETLAERAAAIAGPDLEGQVHDGRILLAGSRDAWLSRPVALAEVAAVETLGERGVDDAVARAAARPLRAFLDRCPVCDGPVRETTLRDCCGGPGGVSGNPERPVRACANCDAVVFTER